MIIRVNREKLLTDDEVGLLYQLDEALHSTRDLDNLLYIILTAATAGKGFSFSRAAIFLSDPERDPGNTRLFGVMGIGPATAEEAGAVWHDLVLANLPLGKLLAGYPGMLRENHFSRRTRELELRLAGDDACTRVMETGETWLLSPPFAAGLAPDGFADVFFGPQVIITPICGREGNAGVLIGDNAFSFREISERQVQLLAFFADRAGNMIELVETNRRLDARVRELKEAYQNLYRLKQRLQHSEQLAVLGRAVATIEHEIRGPVSVIGMMASSIAGQGTEIGEARRFARKIYRKAVDLERFVSKNLAFVRHDPDVGQTCDLGETAREACAEIFTAWEKEAGRFTVSENLSAGLPPAAADAQQVRHVLMNIIENSFLSLAEKGGGAVSLETSCDPEAVWIVIGDDGVGIPAADLDRMFEPFYTTRRQGTGLGLSFARQVVEFYGGAITARSPGVNLGASFTVRLPRADRCRAGPLIGGEGDGEENPAR